MKKHALRVPNRIKKYLHVRHIRTAEVTAPEKQNVISYKKKKIYIYKNQRDMEKFPRNHLRNRNIL